MMYVHVRLRKALAFLLVPLMFLGSCRTIAYHDVNTFVKTAELKAKALTLMDHATEDYATYTRDVDEVLILGEQLFAMQKARDLNHASIGQWKILMERNIATQKSILPSFFKEWKTKGKLSETFVQEARPQVEAAFDEILKLEDSKLKKP
jgi:hypothetical protein